MQSQLARLLPLMRVARWWQGAPSPFPSRSSHAISLGLLQHAACRPMGPGPAGAPHPQPRMLHARSAGGGSPGGADALEELELGLPSHCSGCGVELQSQSPERPGFFQVPRRLLDALQAGESGGEEEEGGEDGGGDLAQFEEDDGELVFDDYIGGGDAAPGAGQAEGGEGPSVSGAGAGEGGQDWKQFDDMVEGWLDDRPPRVEVKSYDEDEGGAAAPGAHVLCARCFSLRNYGAVKSAAAEAALPGFDFERRVGRKIALQKFRRQVVLVVVDVADFDGSLPRAAVRSLMPAELGRELWRGEGEAPLPRGFRLVVAVNKGDLLPKQVTAQRLEAWVRRRMAQGLLPRPSAVHLVSSLKGRGVRELLADLQAAVGARGDVWVVGAQNAGKSSLINAMRQAAGLKADRDVTTAPLPGTTLGLLRVPGLLPSGCKMLDTPGVPHPFQITTHMTPEEMKMLLPRRQLRPRTFRIGPGQTVSVGGLARVDVVQCPGATLYLTVWASDDVTCHLGKTEGAEERYAKHAGSRLTPPVGGPERMAAFPPLAPTDVLVPGTSWRGSSRDVAIAGLGWVGVGVDGEASLRVWAPPGVAVTTHDSLVPDLARELERPGFRGIKQPDLGGGGKAPGGGGGRGGKGGGSGKRR